MKFVVALCFLVGTVASDPKSGCGVSPISRVIGGIDAQPGNWPWQIALLRGRFICGGSLIKPDWVVTAAHCIGYSNRPDLYKVSLGEHDRNAIEGTEETIGVKKLIVHPQYNNPRLNNDIALIQLARPATLNSRVRTVCLPSHDYDVPTSSRCFITGWGKIKHPGSAHPVLQQAQMPPVKNDVCAKKLAASGGSSLKITDQMLCAGVEGTILSGCHGDSGGPYVCQNSAGHWVLQGAVSWGSPRCSAKERFTVFARVAKFRNWIDQHTGGGGGGTVPPPPPVTPAPPGSGFNCNFDSDFCGFSQSRNDKFDWSRRSGRTPSTNTGPSSGHGGRGFYVYIETSGSRRPGDNAILSKTVSLSGSSCLSFYYHMYGSDMGSLKVRVGGQEVFSKSGNQGNKWIEVKDLPLSGSGNKQLEFEGIRGRSYRGDAAIDDVRVFDCQAPPPTPPPPPPPTTQKPPPPPITTQAPPPQPDFSCNFDRDLCGFQQRKDDKFDFTQIRGSTPSGGTGPSADHTSGSGKYIYIETSNPRRPGDNAKISRQVSADGNSCLTFYYHMNGRDVGTLLVRLRDQKVFEKKGSQGNMWKKAEVRLAGSGSVELMFEGVRGRNWQGDIAIDDVSISPCGGPPPPSTPAPPTDSPPTPGSCGQRPNTRIVGGTAAKHGDWPWQAMLRTSSGFPYCGGTLVAHQWVVTATHCVTGKSARSVFVRLGAHKRTSQVGTEQDFKVTKVITHPSYHKPKRYSHDIALLKLEKPAQLNKHVNLACLPQAVAAPGDGVKCWITGWGRLASGGSTPNLLQQVSVPVTSHARCEKSYPGKIHDSMICAGLDQGGIDSCQGDSGGPMVCETGGRYYLHGVTSWGYGCASAGKFGVYAKVTYVMKWLNDEMKKN